MTAIKAMAAMVNHKAIIKKNKVTRFIKPVLRNARRVFL